MPKKHSMDSNEWWADKLARGKVRVFIIQTIVYLAVIVGLGLLAYYTHVK